MTKPSNASCCPICMEPNLNAGNKNYVKTACGHEFCFSCINKSLKTSNLCPCCRTPIEEEKRSDARPINMNEAVELLREEIESFDFATHIDATLLFLEENDEHANRRMMTMNMMNMVRMFSLDYINSILHYERTANEYDAQHQSSSSSSSQPPLTVEDLRSEEEEQQSVYIIHSA